MVDAGSGTLANLQRHLSLGDLDAVIISHSHPDHWSDLDSLAVAYKWVLLQSGLRVLAPQGLRDMLRAGSASEVFEWETIQDGGTAEVADIAFSFSLTDHPVPTFAVRADVAGRSLAYSADSGPAWAMTSLGRDFDLALCEATFLSDKEGSVQHLSARQAGHMAADCGARRLVITHLLPGVDRDAARLEAGSAFGSPVTLASVGDRYPL